MRKSISSPTVLPALNRRAVLNLAFYGVGTAAGLAAGRRQAQAAVSMRYADHATPTHPITLASEAMCKGIEAKTNGELKIAYFPNFALGTSPEQVDQTRRGLIDFAQDAPGPVSAFNKSIGMLNAPYVFDDHRHVWKFLDDTGRPWLTDQFAKAGFVYVKAFEWGFRAMSNNVRPINTPDDVKGLKMRTPPELELQSVYEALGAFPTAINFPEVYMAMASKTVDGQCNSISTFYDAKFSEVQKYLAFTKHQYTASMLFANPKSWEKLSPELQRIVRQEADAAAADAREKLAKGDDDYLDKIAKLGVAVTRPDVGPFRSRMGPAYEKIKASRGEAAFNEVMSLSEKARKA